MWVAIVLPGLLLRSLIPVGFMPMFGPGLSVSLMLCPVYAPVPPLAVQSHETRSDEGAGKSMDMSAGVDMSMAMDMGMPSTDEPTTGNNSTSGGQPDHQDHSSCPYAASATLAGVPTLLGVTVAEQSVTRLALPGPQITHFTMVPRAQSARAPPVPA